MTLTPKLLTIALLIATPLDTAQESSTAEEKPEFPPVRLPRSSIHDSPDPALGAVLTVLTDGRVLAGGKELIHDPKAPGRSRLQDWLQETAAGMRKGESHHMPDEPLLLRVDALAPFESVMAVMMACGHKSVSLAKIEFAVLTADAEAPGEGLSPAPTTESGMPLRAHLPSAEELGDPDDGASVLPQVSVTVLAAGERIPGENPAAPFLFDRNRKVEFRVGAAHAQSADALEDTLRTLRSADERGRLNIEPASGVTHGEVVALMEVARRAGFDSFAFTPADH